MLHFVQKLGVREQCADAFTRFIQARRQLGADKFGVTGAANLFGVFVKYDPVNLTQRSGLSLALNQSLQRFLNATQFPKSAPGQRKAVVQMSQRRFSKRPLVRQSRAHTLKFVGKDQRIGPCNSP